MSTSFNRYVLIGNGIAGTTAAELLRKNDVSSSITLITDEPYPLYNRVGLSFLLEKKEVGLERVMMRSAEDHEKLNIRLRTGMRVTGVNTGEKSVVLHTGEEIPYDKLFIATGGKANRLHVPGADRVDSYIYNFQSLADSLAIRERLHEARQAVVLGGSFIAFELAECFQDWGVEVSWLMRGPWFMRRTLDAEGGALAEAIISDYGVHPIHGEEIAELTTPPGASAFTVVSTAGRELGADLLGIGLGLKPSVDFLAGTDVRVGAGIRTDEHMRTSNLDIYAGGDVCEFFDTLTGQPMMLGTWDNATGHGRVAAMNMLGGNEVYSDVATYTTPYFNSNIAVSGITRETNKDLTSLKRVEMEQRRMRELFFLDGRLVGFTMIGEIKGRKKLLSLIRSRQVVEDQAALLSLV